MCGSTGTVPALGCPGKAGQFVVIKFFRGAILSHFKLEYRYLSYPSPTFKSSQSQHSLCLFPSLVAQGKVGVDFFLNAASYHFALQVHSLLG